MTLTTFWPKYDWTIIVHFIHCLLDAKLEGGLYLNWELRNGVFSLRNWDEYDWELRIDPSWDWEIKIFAWENEAEDVEKWEWHFILRIEKVLFDLFIWEKYEPFFDEFDNFFCVLRSKSHTRYTWIELWCKTRKYYGLSAFPSSPDHQVSCCYDSAHARSRDTYAKLLTFLILRSIYYVESFDLCRLGIAN